jgi:hypothetical protein
MSSVGIKRQITPDLALRVALEWWRQLPKDMLAIQNDIGTVNVRRPL